MPGSLLQTLEQSPVRTGEKFTGLIHAAELVVTTSSDRADGGLRYVYVLSTRLTGWAQLYSTRYLSDSDYVTQWEPKKGD